MTQSQTPTGLRKLWVSIAHKYSRFVEPNHDGLPRIRVLLAFPLVLFFIGAVLVGASLNGSSSGAFFPEVSQGSDPNLLMGEPQKVRSDEWNVGIPWIISQVEQGLPDENKSVPGGMDADLPYDLPHGGVSMVFKPHLWGFLFMDVDHGVAWKWWMPGLCLIAAAYLFLVTLLPRRAMMSAAISVAFFYSPFFQWWYQTTTLWPVVWALIVLTAMFWCVEASRAKTLAGRAWFSWKWWPWSIVVAYFTVVMAMGVYAPFIVPVAYVVVFAALGLVIQSLTRGMRVTELLGRAVPVIVGGLVGSAIVVIWLQSKKQVVDGLLSTVYPGERYWGTGGGGALTVAQVVASSFSDALRISGGFLGLNSSEASTFFLVGVFLVPVIGWLIVRRVKAGHQLPWVAIALVAVLVLFAAWVLLPGWDAISHFLMLDRTTPGRIRIGLGLASLALLACIIRELDHAEKSGEGRPGKILASALAGLFLLSQVAVAAAVLMVLDTEHLWGAAPLWWVWALISAASIYAYARSRAIVGTALFLIVAVASSAAIHPLYRGAYDLRETKASHAVVALDKKDPETWVGIGGLLVGAILIESGVETMNGTQGAPSKEMWHEIDPTNQFEAEWNRIGAVRWVPGVGEPRVSNPAPDVILSTFDACSIFAQQNVGRVLADSELTSPCLDEVSTFDLPKYDLIIYRVVPAQ